LFDGCAGERKAQRAVITFSTGGHTLRPFKNKVVLASVLGLIALFAAACGSSTTGASTTATTYNFTYNYQTPTKTGGTVVLADYEFPDSVNPLGAGLVVDFELIPALWDACVVQLPDLTLGSQGWKADLCAQVPTTANGGESADGKTTTFKIDPKAVWSDGTPITAKDFLLTYQIESDPNGIFGDPPPFAYMTSVKALDNQTVQIKWANPYAPYLSALWAPEPEHVYGAYNTAKYTALLSAPAFNSTFTVDSGAYVLSSFTQDQSITLTANPKFFSNFFHAPALSKVVFKSTGDVNTLIEGYKAGQFDHAEDFTIASVPSFNGIPADEQITSPQDSYEHFDFNERSVAPSANFSNDGNSIFGGPNGKLVRKAFIESFDLCGAFVTILGDSNCHDPNLYTAENVAPPDLAYDPSVTLPSYNVKQAQADLAAAGYPGGKNSKGKQVQVTLVTTTGNAVRNAFIDLASQEWTKNLGVIVNIAQYKAGTLFTLYSKNGTLATGNYDIALFAYVNGADDDGATGTFQSDQIPGPKNDGGGNYMGVSDPKIDQYLKTGRTSLDDAVRKQTYHDLFAYIASQYINFPLYIRADYTLTKTTLGNYKQNPTSAGNEWNLNDWFTTGTTSSFETQ
jgi:peptide/nickel transport system substrate-binding protein